ncbi:MAG: alpha/beta hydrolase [Erysipelotrichales bacterium]|nr:alpha/beta hydrolase [Erysipelotrichales bacterium]
MMILKHIEIAGPKILRGYWTYQNNKDPLVIMFHGFTGNKNENTYLFKSFSKVLATNGFSSLRIDFSGNGDSDGDFQDMTATSLIDDALRIITYARENINKKIILLGFSMGGFVASQLIKSVSEVEKVILWAPAGNLSKIGAMWFDNKAKILPNGNCDLGGMELSYQFYQELIDYPTYDQLENFEGPVLIVHGENDQAVSLSYGIKYLKAFPNAELEIITKANHGFGTIDNRQRLYQKTLEFLGKGM